LIERYNRDTQIIFLNQEHFYYFNQ